MVQLSLGEGAKFDEQTGHWDVPFDHLIGELPDFGLQELGISVAPGWGRAVHLTVEALNVFKYGKEKETTDGP